MATITKSASAPAENVTFSFAAGDIALDDSSNTSFTTDDHALIAAAHFSPELEVSEDEPVTDAPLASVYPFPTESD